jgi:serine phosphatase RsbU (regulator of sigma subunit)
VPEGSSLYLFSDGLFEIVTKDQQRWALDDLLPLLLQPASNGTPDVTKVSKAERVYNAVREVAAPGPLEDDVSLLVVTFT